MEQKYKVNMALGKIIYRKNISCAKLARSVGMRPEILSRIINCKRSLYADELSPLCEALEIKIEELFREE